MKYLFVVLFFVAFSSATAAEYKAVDGDSLVRGDERIRLKGIDAPELYQE